MYLIPLMHAFTNCLIVDAIIKMMLRAVIIYLGIEFEFILEFIFLNLS